MRKKPQHRNKNMKLKQPVPSQKQANPVPGHTLVPNPSFVRQTFLHGWACLTLLFFLGALPPWALAKGKDSGLPKPNKSGIDHIVVVMMENRSFDHFLGWL